MSQTGVVYFSSTKSTSKICCCVPGCNSSPRRDGTVRFHRFPKEGQEIVEVKNIFVDDESIDRHLAWKSVLRIETNVMDQMLVCSKHFTKDDYYFSGK